MTPADWADQAAEAIRRLNHATLSSEDGYVHPSDVDATLANLQVLVQRLPQALVQMRVWLKAQAQAGRVGHDAIPMTFGREAAAVHAMASVMEAADELATAAAWLSSVNLPLTQARKETSHLTGF